ncbi:MAG: tetratricopeptide repeat protein [Saprospiraceae bacterium]
MAKEKKDNTPSEETLANAVESKSITEVFEENKSLITYLLVGLLVAVGGYIMYRQMVKIPKEKEAIEQMAQAQTQFERDSFALALTNPGLGSLGFADIAEEYGSTKAGNLALYYAGICYLHLGQFDAAIDYLEDFSPAGDITPAMKSGALGDAYSEKNDFGKALSLYKSASNSDNALIAAYYLKKWGMLSEHQGDAASARQAYQTIKDKYFDTPIATDIDKFLVRVSE